jgi:molecular chaperone GrpE
MSEPTGKPNTDGEASAQAPEGQSQAAQTAQPNEQPTSTEVPQDELSVLKAALENAHREVEKSREVYLRLAADMENLRRRTQEDVAKAHKYAIESFAESLVPVRDSLEMALAVENQTPEALKDGVSATLRQLESAFEKGRVVVLNPVGEKFNPNQHQAVAMVPGDSVEPAVAPNHVVAVLQKGYLINDRVLRPALVSVAQ